VKWSQSQTHEPSSCTRSPRSGQAQRGKAALSHSVCSRFTFSPVPVRFPVPSRYSSAASGSTLTTTSYERCVNGLSIPVGCTASHGSNCASTRPCTHCGGGGGPVAGALRSLTYAQFGDSAVKRPVGLRSQPSATASVMGFGRVAEIAAAPAAARITAAMPARLAVLRLTA
jgi:hypothetical protein